MEWKEAEKKFSRIWWWIKTIRFKRIKWNNKYNYRINIPPFAYKLNGEIIGNEKLYIYRFAEFYGYKVNFIEAETIQEIIDCLKEKKCGVEVVFSLF